MIPTRKTLLISALLAALGGRSHAALQGRLNVVADALASAQGIAAQKVAVAGFSEAGSGQRNAFCHHVEEGLRKALNQAKRWKIAEEGEDPSQADAVLSGSYIKDASGVTLYTELRMQPGDALLWKRSLVIPESEVPAADLAGEDGNEAATAATQPEPLASALPGQETHVIPTLPPPPPRKPHHFHVDVSLGYKAFFPANGNFQNIAGARQDGVSLGLAFQDIVLLDFDAWAKTVDGLGTVQSLDYLGTAISVVYPLRLGKHVVLYAGPGGRFGSLGVDDTAYPHDYARFGLNSLDAVAGAKLKAGHAGLDLRYSADLTSIYTSFQTLRLGAFYEFGR